MSQEKVDKYKKDKANRKKIMKREKMVKRVEIGAIVVVLAGAIAWFSHAVYENSKSVAASNVKTSTTELDTSALETYLQSLGSIYTTDSVSADSSADESVSTSSASSASE